MSHEIPSSVKSVLTAHGYKCYSLAIGLQVGPVTTYSLMRDAYCRLTGKVGLRFPHEERVSSPPDAAILHRYLIPDCRQTSAS